MTGLFDLLFHPLSNAIMTVLTGITALYWIFTFIAGDFFGDGGVETDLDFDGADLDTDVDSDAEVGDAVEDKPFYQKALEFVNIGKVPFMVVYSTFKFIAWIVTLVSSVTLGLASWGWKSVFILLPAFLVAFLITRFATKPLVKIYKAMGYNGEEPTELLGRIARMRSTISGDTIGAAELKVQSDVIRVNVKSKTGETIAYDAEVMIADESADKKYYLVVPEINLSNVV
ncbi:OB-fold-containig protein [Paraflavitalea sp. CAU 1676]|uniref:OB-fold-containig protein n=1 Tax=Paraflavitalea sp. CAU 1676 TaxID=3032598 RepID=UPI0023DB6C02|nr:OB-fold-containig protein [Paraflavitalea sp. CAU 1676]MDF2187410.1 DUF1449 family protein [Paraflavitalea sp. CAU 1676]